MYKYIKKTIKATIKYLVVALLVMVSILLCIYLLIGKNLEKGISLINKISIDVENKKDEIIVIKNNKVQNYPEYGTQYAYIEIPKIDVNLPVYFGDTLAILKNGIGHSSGSYFPGEGGSIVYMGHNTKKFLHRFPDLKIGDEITIKASYGEYKYKVYDIQIIKETELEKLPIQKDKEILMLYTCYPINNIGYTTQRYVAYSELIN